MFDFTKHSICDYCGRIEHKENMIEQVVWGGYSSYGSLVFCNHECREAHKKADEEKEERRNKRRMKK